MEGVVFNFDFDNPVRIRARRLYWCSSCGKFHEKGFFWRRHGKLKGCGNTFKKGDLGKGGKGGTG